MLECSRTQCLSTIFFFGNHRACVCEMFVSKANTKIPSFTCRNTQGEVNANLDLSWSITVK